MDVIKIRKYPMNSSVHFPIQIVFLNFSHSQAVEDSARKHAEKLGQYFDHIMSCNVGIETHHHHHKGNIYHVRIDLRVPNTELVANRDLPENHAHEDVYVAIRDAFNAMKRQLQAYAHKQRGDVKNHIPQPEGRILEIAPLADYGYIETSDGRRIRFTSNSVIDFDFTKLEVGKRVRFVEVINNEGPAASTVYVM